MWRCSCGQRFVDPEHRDAKVHTGHSFQFHGPSRDVPSALPGPEDEKFDLTDVVLPPDTVTEPAAEGAFARAVAAEHAAATKAMEERDKRHAELPFFKFPEADVVNAPAHYAFGEIECIDAIRSCLGHEGFVAYCHGNLLKYTWRHKHKGKSAEDLAKADYYLARMRESE